MTGNEAIRMLKAAGFRHVRTDTSGHAHYELGKHRIMVSPGSQDIKDSSATQRIEKLCRGDLTARDLQREAHQQKGELPNDLFRPGDRVEHTEDPSRGVGTVHTVDWQARTATVEWKTFTSKNVHIEQLRLVQGEEDTMPEEKPEEEIPELDIPLVEEKRPEVRTLLDELQNLELVSEIEYEELVALRDGLLRRVDAYERVYSLSEQLGITMRALPWREESEYPKTFKSVIEVEIPLQPPTNWQPVTELPVPVTRRDEDQILLDEIKRRGGYITVMSVSRLKLGVSDVKGKLLSLTQQGRLRYSVERDGAGRGIGRWTLA